MIVLFVGDVVGKPGRRAFKKLLPGLRSSLGASFVIANGENSAGGLGITRQTGAELLDSGADVITLGNHSFSKREAFDYVLEEPRLLRPANYPSNVPGKGMGVYETANGCRIAVVSVLGRTFMEAVDCPFRAADAALSEIAEATPVIVFDVHAEATSEKTSLAWHLDGRASAVIGTHTHVQTSDERVLPNGTAYITDVGMTGVVDSVLGLDCSSVIERFRTCVTRKFKLAEGAAALHAVSLDIDEATGCARGVTRLVVSESVDS